VFEQSDADIAVVDGEHPELRATIEDLGYRVVGETWLRTVDGVDPGLRERVIDATGSVDAGLRFGPRAREYTGAIVVIELPEKLLDTVQGIDREAARDAIEARALAYETAEAGNRLTGTVALPTDVSRAAIIESLLPVLRDNYDAVEVTTDAIVVEEYTFDPSKARTLGVQEGPKFGALASGETIEVDGRTIEPDAVRTTERTTLPR
jgi:D-aminoacyl-tRNA deacylase